MTEPKYIKNVSYIVKQVIFHLSDNNLQFLEVNFKVASWGRKLWFKCLHMQTYMGLIDILDQ